jgi:hypothetical protein
MSYTHYHDFTQNNPDFEPEYDTYDNKRKISQREINLLDIDFLEIKRKKLNGNVKNVGCFKSGSQGCSIRNAITGIRNYNHKVGSFDEDLYFKVNITTENHRKVFSPLDGELKQQIILFFNSPKECETHLLTELNSETKKRWIEKYNQRNHDNLFIEYEEEHQKQKCIIIH